MWGGGTAGLCAAFVFLAYLAPDLFGEALGWVVRAETGIGAY